MTARAYAAGSDVPVIKSIAELDTLLGKYGATGFTYGRDADYPMTRVMFKIKGRTYRFDVTKPTWQEFRQTRNYQSRTQDAAERAADAEERRRWRALILYAKAVLVAVADGVVDLESALLPHAVLPSGDTVAEWAGPQLLDPDLMPSILPGTVKAIES